MTDDVAILRRRIDSLVKAAARIRTHVPDLYRLGWEKAVGEVEKVNGGQPDRTPAAGDPRARDLFEQIMARVSAAEAELVGLDRAMTALFYAGSSNPESSRGSTIRREEFDQLRAYQRRRPDTPVRLVEQPPHPGASR